ncbi:WG repeat-containing protein [Flavobacterium sp. HTF]|uniref:WG repeat-containing protein n=1 Tax=Flavobacterium sp. HTF TaxID=2170732 RepID=UPI000D5C5D94|nr:WG repeat-containing protein [Flavobacterium sp. HTF]PWB22313.1 hypothetical protein DCO46_17530 [Flavobacterium sp. HTF]
MIDKNGKEIVPIIYDELERLDDGFAYVGINIYPQVYKWGIVNEQTGKLITPLKYQQTFNEDHPGFSSTKKMARITSDNKVGVIDENGKKIISPVYDAIDALGDICAVYKNNKYGYINSKGKIIISIENDCITNPDFFYKVRSLYIEEGLLLLLHRNGKYGFTNKKGISITPIKYDSIERSIHGGAFVKINKKCGYINKNGKETIPVRFDTPLSKMSTYFDEGILIFKENNKWGAIDSTGVNIIKPKYDSMTDFAKGFSIGTIGNKSYIIDKKGKATQTLKYDKIEKSSAKVALVSINGKWGAIDQNNKLITPIKYDKIEEFNYDFAITEIKFNKYGFPISKPLDILGLSNFIKR